MKKNGKGMFGGLGKNNPMKLFADLPKIQKTIQKSLDEFAEETITNEFQDGLITITSKGEVIKGIQVSDDLADMIQNDREMAEDILVASLSAMNKVINEKRMKKVEEDAKSSGLNPQLVNQVFNNDLLSNLM